jgi:hypothetical protein
MNLGAYFVTDAQTRQGKADSRIFEKQSNCHPGLRAGVHFKKTMINLDAASSAA